jgi:hypothetical protein
MTGGEILLKIIQRTKPDILHWWTFGNTTPTAQCNYCDGPIQDRELLTVHLDRHLKELGLLILI